MTDKYIDEFKGKTVLVTGGTGSIGAELVKKILGCEPAHIRVFSRDETKQYELMEELDSPPNLRLLIGDIRDKERVSFAFKGVDIVLHAAAMKHVAISEYNPFEAVSTNIIGSQNVIASAIEQNVGKVIGISTDKAVNPTSVMGASKLMMEKLFINANNYVRKEVTKFSCARFGNVLWSRGSVLPSWKKQAEKSKKIRITSKDMTRFFMSKQEAIDLVLRAAVLTQGGELFTFKMPSAGIADLAQMFVNKYYPNQKIDIEIAGVRGGEKIHEELFDSSDFGKQILSDGEMFIILPRLRLAGLPKEVKPEADYPGFEKLERAQNLSSESRSGLDKIKQAI